MISNKYTYEKSLLTQQKENSKHHKKKNPCNNKPNKGPKPSESAHSLKTDKGTKPKGKKSRSTLQLLRKI